MQNGKEKEKVQEKEEISPSNSEGFCIIMRSFVILFIFVLALAFWSGGVGAVECGSIPTEACTVSSSIQFTTGNYNFNGTSAGNAIRINANNLILDCNNSIIYGNYTIGEDTSISRGISFNVARDNITIINCNVNNYWASFRPRGSNITFINITTNNSFYGVDFEFTNRTIIKDSNFNFSQSAGIYFGNSFDNTILNNVFYENKPRGYSIKVEDGSLYNNITFNNFYFNVLWLRGASKYNIISNNNFYYGNLTYGSLFIGSTQSAEIYNNNFINSIIYGNSSAIYDEGGNNLNIYNNTLTNLIGIGGPSKTKSIAIHISLNSENITLSNNTINMVDLGIFVSGANNILIEGNNINNTYINNDNYETGIAFGPRAVSNFVIRNNTITDFGSGGIAFQNSTNGLVYNNYIYGLQDRVGKEYFDRGEPQAGIGFYELFKGFSGDGTHQNWWNISETSRYRNNNITVYNNTILGVSILIRNTGSTNITLDNFNNLYKSFQQPYLSGRYEFYLNPSYKNISRINLTFSLETNGLVCSWTNCSMQYELYRDYEKYTSLNNISFQLNLYNLSSALIYLNNGTVLGNKNNTFNSLDFNITLPPNNASIILNDFNLTEGITRLNSPLSIASSSETSRTITSTLTDTITPTIVFHTTKALNTIATITVTSPTGNTTTYANAQIPYSNGDITFNNNPIEPGASLLSITFVPANYNCGGIANMFSSVITQSSVYFGLIMLLLIIGISLGYLKISPERYNFGQILIFLSILVAVCIALGFGYALTASIPCN